MNEILRSGAAIRLARSAAVAGSVALLAAALVSAREARAADCSVLGNKDYCAWWYCGPCNLGEGDCDPGQCAPGLACVEAGAVDTCQVRDRCAITGASDYCSSSRCGPCDEGEGDCDPGQCATGLECVEEGAVDTCQVIECGTTGASDYCSSSKCGPCNEGEGDCDPGQCASGLECVEEGAIDTCHAVESDSLEVWHEGAWWPVCCEGSRPNLSIAECAWTLDDRFLTDETNGVKLDCLEGDPTDCLCNSVGESQHGTEALDTSGGGPLYPNHLEETCVVVKDDGVLATDWADSSCPSFRLD